MGCEFHVAGRVINVEKSAGGKDAEKRKQKITEFRQQQNEKIKATITNILNEYEGKKVIKVSSKSCLLVFSVGDA